MKIEEFINSSSERKRVFLSFSVGSSPIEVKNIESKNFSESSNDQEDYNFSLRERIRYAKMTPKAILRLRIREVANYCRSSSVDKILANRELILNYINEYVYQQIINLLNSSSSSQFNLILKLGLNTVMTNTNNTRAFQRLMIRIKKYLQSQGTIPIQMQKKLNAAYVKFWNDLVVGIESKYLPKEKQGVLSVGKVDSTLKTSKMANLEHDDTIMNFSKTIRSAQELIDSINNYFNNLDPESSIEDILSFINKFRSSEYTIPNKFKDEFLEYDILSDADLTKLIADYIFDGKGLIELSQYLSDSMSNRFLHNFSDVTIYPGLIQWNETRNKCYVPGNDLNWYVFEITNEGDTVRLVCKSYPNTVAFKDENSTEGKVIYDKVEDSELNARMNISKAIDSVCSKIKCFSDNDHMIAKTPEYELYSYSINGNTYDLVISNFSKGNCVVEVKKYSDDVPKDMNDRLDKSPITIYDEVSNEELEEIKSNFSNGIVD